MKKTVLKISFDRKWYNDKAKVDVYYFNIEFTDGKKGQFSSNKQEQIKFKEGQEYDVVIKSVTKKGTEMYDIIKENKENNGFNNPIGQLHAARSSSIEAALKLVHKLSPKKDLETIIKTTDYILKWVYEKEHDRQTLIDRQGALKKAVMCIEISELDIKEITDVILLADQFSKYINQ